MDKNLIREIAALKKDLDTAKVQVSVLTRSAAQQGVKIMDLEAQLRAARIIIKVMAKDRAERINLNAKRHPLQKH